jgi:serine/threonine protein kinase
LKLDNLLLVNKDDISAMKIADFGIARKEGSVSGLSQMKTVCGTTRECCCAPRPPSVAVIPGSRAAEPAVHAGT